MPNKMDEFVILNAGTRTRRFNAVTGAFVVSDLTLAPPYDFQSRTGITLKAARPGDADFDGLVDVADLGILGANLTPPTPIGPKPTSTSTAPLTWQI